MDKENKARVHRLVRQVFGYVAYDVWGEEMPSSEEAAEIVLDCSRLEEMGTVFNGSRSQKFEELRLLDVEALRQLRELSYEEQMKIAMEVLP